MSAAPASGERAFILADDLDTAIELLWPARLPDAPCSICFAKQGIKFNRQLRRRSRLHTDALRVYHGPLPAAAASRLEEPLKASSPEDVGCRQAIRPSRPC